jgi:hypothetical protein
MIAGLVIGGHVRLAKIALAAGSGMTIVHAAQKRLSRHLDSPHWSMEPAVDKLLAWPAEMVGEDSLIVADVTDVAKDFARSLEGSGRVPDASDPDRRTVPGTWYSRLTFGWGGGSCFPGDRAAENIPWRADERK